MALTDVPDRLTVGASVLVEGEAEPRRIMNVGASRHGPILRLDGVTDRATAAALIGRHLSALDAPGELPAGTYWWHELEGLDVVDPDGRPLGRLEEVFRAGANEVYRVVSPEAELLVPALRSVVLEIDLSQGRMTVRDPAEWLEEV
jgi:16S rRNA processing protein RimM